MTDEQKDPTERDREDEDLEMGEEEAEDVKGGAGLDSSSDFSMAKKISGGPIPTSSTSPTPTTSPTISVPTTTTSSSPNPLQRP